jgi:hypothetical protein
MVLLAIAALLSSVTVREALAQTIRAALVKNVDEPARAPFQFFLQARRGDPQCGTNFCGFYLGAVPANKRLVITNVSATINLDSTAVVQHLRLLVYDPSFNILSQFTVPFNPDPYPADTISAGSPRRYVVNEQLRWYVEAGKNPLLDFHTTGGGLDTSWPNQFLITGYLVDLTQ